MDSDSSSDEVFEKRKLLRLKECHTKLGGCPKLIQRNFQRVVLDKNEVTKNTLRVMQYNILAEALAYGSPTTNFHKVPPDCLLWTFRRERITEQILSLDPDVICLEEVDHFDDFFKPMFTDLGYNCFFFPKNDSPCLKMPNNNGPDGVALFHRNSRFVCMGHTTKYLANVDNHESNQPIIVCMFSDNINDKKFCIAVTHFKAKKGFEKVRFAQANHTLQIVKDIRQQYDENSAVIICGDMNGTTDEEFYSVFQGDNKIDLKSAYCKAMGSEAPFTTWKIRDVEVKHTIDYIWYQPSKMDVISCLGIPNEADVPDYRFPNFLNPSDHLPLCFDFSFK